MQVRMAGYELGEGIHHRDHRLSHLFRFHARRGPEGPGACHPTPLEGDAASEWMFHTLLKLGHKNVTKKHPFQCGLEGVEVIFIPSCLSSPRLFDKENENKGNDEYAVHRGFKSLPRAKMGN
jgi:hypothetical protein